MPPSLPTQISFGRPGHTWIACTSACNAVVPSTLRTLLANVAPPSLDRMNSLGVTSLSLLSTSEMYEPPVYTTLGLPGSVAIGLSYQHCVLQKPCAPVSSVHVVPLSIDLNTRPPALAPDAVCPLLTKSTVFP